MYSSTLREHAIRPKNRREMTDPTAVGKASYHRCGDHLTMFFRVEGELITEVTFTARGCGPVIAAASLATTLLQGRKVEEASKLGAFELHDALGGMPASKRHSLLLVLQCLTEALEVLKAKQKI